MKRVINRICCLLYADETKDGIDLFVENATKFAVIPGFNRWIDLLFDAADRGDYIYLADVLCFEILPKVA